MMKQNYRADIDGLRALAVLSVVFNHAGFALFPGGFVGVDVFFVISGYLITGIIARELEEGSFSLVRFYERRVRRIFPALFAMLLATTLASALLYDAENFKDYGRSVIAATFFFSNVHFWQETGYFDAPAQLKPLLHTWSLAVEEQFYIFFPLLMAGLSRLTKRKTAWILSALVVISFTYSVYEVYGDAASAAFYLPQARIWELLIGCLLALLAHRISAGMIVRNVISFIGLGLIAASVFLYSENTSFPGLTAAVPVIGTALILFGGVNAQPLVNRILSLPPMVFIGKISYSLYLWHWGLIIFAKYYAIKPLSAFQSVLLVFVALAISSLSWKFIEQPFREKMNIPRGVLFRYAAGAMTLAALIGWLIVAQKGFPAREETAALLDKNAETRVWSVPCRLTGCPAGKQTAPPVFAIWGDSMAPSLYDGISLSAEQHDVGGQLFYTNGCAPLLGIQRTKSAPRCLKNNDQIFDYISAHPELHTVILASRWALWVEGTPNNFTENEKEIAMVDTWEKPSEADTSIILAERALDRTVAALVNLDREVIIISQVPEVGYDVPSAYFITQHTGRDLNQIISPALSDYLVRTDNTRRILNAVAQKYNATVLDPAQILCDSSRCLTLLNEHLLYMDAYHLSVFGSRTISPIYDSLFETLVLQTQP